jgi:hypothetical protein
MASQTVLSPATEDIFSFEHATKLDLADPAHLRKEFLIPTKADVASTSIARKCRFFNSDENMRGYSPLIEKSMDRSICS